MEIHSINIKVNRLILILGMITGILAIASFVRILFFYTIDPQGFPSFLNLFNMDAENNIPVFFTVMLLLACSLTLALIFSISTSAYHQGQWGWAGLSILFLVMALDKGVRIHEYITRPLMTLLRDGDQRLIIIFSIVITALAGIVAIFYIFRFVLRQSNEFKKSFFIAFGIYIAGAVFLDAIGSAFYHPGGKNNLVNNIITVIEESTEMAGIIAFIRVFLIFIKTELPPLSLNIEH